MNAKHTLAIAAAGVLAVAGLYAAIPSSGPEQETARGGCGVERWSQKVMTDPLAAGVNLTPVTSSVADLVAFPRAPKNQVTRLPAEEQAYHIDAQLQSVKLEQDGDFHLVLTSGSQSMIVEAPDPNCAVGSVVLPQIQKARQEVIAACGQPSATAFTPCRHDVWVTGVAFLDFLHGQTGVAKNGIELHPILDFVVTDKGSYP